MENFKSVLNMEKNQSLISQISEQGEKLYKSGLELADDCINTIVEKGEPIAAEALAKAHEGVDYVMNDTQFGKVLKDGADAIDRGIDFLSGRARLESALKDNEALNKRYQRERKKYKKYVEKAQVDINDIVNRINDYKYQCKEIDLPAVLIRFNCLDKPSTISSYPLEQFTYTEIPEHHIPEGEDSIFKNMNFVGDILKYTLWDVPFNFLRSFSLEEKNKKLEYCINEEITKMKVERNRLSQIQYSLGFIEVSFKQLHKLVPKLIDKLDDIVDKYNASGQDDKILFSYESTLKTIDVMCLIMSEMSNKQILEANLQEINEMRKNINSRVKQFKKEFKKLAA